MLSPKPIQTFHRKFLRNQYVFLLISVCLFSILSIFRNPPHCFLNYTLLSLRMFSVEGDFFHKVPSQPHTQLYGALDKFTQGGEDHEDIPI